MVLVQQEANPHASLQALIRARASGAFTLLNPAPAITGNSELQALADLITPNESEFAALLGDVGETLAAEIIAGMPAAQLHRLARKLCSPAVIITLGARGALLSQDSGYREFTAPAVSVRDSTGAGDCFNGALAAELAEGAGLIDACAFAVKAASCKVERSGAALAMPSRADIYKRFPD